MHFLHAGRQLAGLQLDREIAFRAAEAALLDAERICSPLLRRRTLGWHRGLTGHCGVEAQRGICLARRRSAGLVAMARGQSAGERSCPVDWRIHGGAHARSARRRRRGDASAALPHRSPRPSPDHTGRHNAVAALPHDRTRSWPRSVRARPAPDGVPAMIRLVMRCMAMVLRAVRQRRRRRRRAICRWATPCCTRRRPLDRPSPCPGRLPHHRRRQPAWGTAPLGSRRITRRAPRTRVASIWAARADTPAVARRRRRGPAPPQHADPTGRQPRPTRRGPALLAARQPPPLRSCARADTPACQRQRPRVRVGAAARVAAHATGPHRLPQRTRTAADHGLAWARATASCTASTPSRGRSSPATCRAPPWPKPPR